MSDPRMDGFLLTVWREGETADPWMEAEAVAQGLAWRSARQGRLYLTASGRWRLREVGLL